MRHLSVLAVLLLAACGGPPEMPQMPPPEVGVASPIVRELAVERVFTGRIEPIDIVEVSPRVSGTVVTCQARSGRLVAAGDVLFEIDPAPFRIAVERGEAAVAGAAAALKQASETRDRNQELRGAGLIAEEQFAERMRSVEVNEALLAAAKANLANARLELEWTKVRAPIAGRLGLISITVGSQVQGGGAMPPSVITTLMSVSPVYAAFDLDEATYLRIAPRLAASVRGEKPAPVRVGLAGGTDWPFSGRIVFIDNHVDPASGTIRLRALLEAKEDAPPPGAFARISLEVEPARPVVLVHEQAVQAELATRYVLTVDEKGGTAKVPVQLGARHGALREVTGLPADSRIVVTNTAKVMMPGMPVAGKPTDMETLAPAEGK
jgi:multidrug efflux system membrane fusion protein